MLAPSVITVRRPSCEADLILARIETGSSFYPILPASDSVQSAPLYDYWTPPEGDDLTELLEGRPGGGIMATDPRSCMTGRRQDSLGALCVSPDTRIKYGHRRSMPGFKEGGIDDGSRSGPPERRCSGDSGGIRRASLTLRRSIDSLLCTLATKSSRVPVERSGLSIEVVQESPIFRRRIRMKQRGKSLDKVQEDFAEDDLYSQSTNLFLSLVLVSLKDGLLSAEIPISELQRIPCGHVKIRIRNYNLDVCISAGEDRGAPPPKGDCARGEPPPPPGCSYRGSVSLPIYVNPSTLQFRLDDTRGVVHLEGKIKGSCTRIGTSLSAMELSRSATTTAATTTMMMTSSESVATGNGLS